MSFYSSTWNGDRTIGIQSILNKWMNYIKGLNSWTQINKQSKNIPQLKRARLKWRGQWGREQTAYTCFLSLKCPFMCINRKLFFTYQSWVIPTPFIPILLVLGDKVQSLKDKEVSCSVLARWLRTQLWSPFWLSKVSFDK